MTGTLSLNVGFTGSKLKRLNAFILNARFARELYRCCEPQNQRTACGCHAAFQKFGPFESRRAPWHSTFLSTNIATARVTRDRVLSHSVSPDTRQNYAVRKRLRWSCHDSHVRCTLRWILSVRCTHRFAQTHKTLAGHSRDQAGAVKSTVSAEFAACVEACHRARVREQWSKWWLVAWRHALDWGGLSVDAATTTCRRKSP